MTKELPCPGCGQLVICNIPSDKELSESDEKALALSACSCPAARLDRAEKAQIAEAQDNINMLCGEGAEENSMQPIECQDVHDILNKAAELVAKGKIFELTVKVSGCGTKGQIKVKRTVGFSEQLEANQKY